MRLLATEGRLPIAADCWQCYHPPLFYLAGWPLYAIGLWFGGPEWADRCLSGLSLVAVGVITLYGYRLLDLYGFRGAPRVGGLALLVASPLLFISSYGAEADVLLSAILVVFVFHLARASSSSAGFGPRAVVTLGILAGLAMATKYSGLVSLASAGVLTVLRLIVRTDRSVVIRQGLAIMAIALAIGAWKYVDNYRTYGTAFHANGSASQGLRLGARRNRGGYEFTTFRLGELQALFGPRPVAGSLTTFPVYKSVFTSLHAQAWSDMSLFSVPSRHGDPGLPYKRRITPVRLVTTVILLGLVPPGLALVGFVVTARDRAHWPLATMTLVTTAAYVAWFLPQTTWALKAKYIAVLVPVLTVYAMAGGVWIGRRASWMGWLIATAIAALVGASFVYQFAFANGRL